MRYNFWFRSIKWFCILCAVLIWISSVKAGTILLLGIGLGTPGTPAPPAGCNGVIALQGCVDAFALGIQ